MVRSGAANVQQLMRLFAATYAHEMDQVAEELGLTRTQAVLLGSAGDRPGSIRELADRMGCDPSNLTGVVHRLTERGLIDVEPDLSDRRVKLIGLSEMGAQTVRRLNHGVPRLRTAIEGASQAELAALGHLLERVLNL
jgi:DNA-binding MarR family transcriptional regulator